MTEDYKTKYQIGSKWKTRGGDVAEVIYHNDGAKFPIIALIVGSSETNTYTENGNFFESENSKHDLIEPYIEPKRVVGYLNVYEDYTSSQLHETRTAADHIANKDRIACIRVEWTEGQFDE